MKKLLFLAGAALLIVALKFDDRINLDSVVARLTLPFKAALLYAREPDHALAVPVDGIGVRQIRSTWHAPRSGDRLHEGQDIFAKRGTAVRSATAGYVTRVGENALGGKIVFVLGAGGRSYYYAHLDAHAEELAAGDYVTPETVLGYVGTTGNAAGTAPHLHFGVYTPGGAIDPLPFLTDRPAAPPPDSRKAGE